MLYVAIAPVVAAASPKLTQLAAEHSGQLANAYRRYTQLMTISIVPFASVLITFPEHLLLLWTRDADLSSRAAPIVSLYAIGTLFNAFLSLPSMLQIAYGWTSFAVKLNGAALCIFIPALLIVAPRSGGIGAGALWAVLNLLLLSISAPVTHRKIFPSQAGPSFATDILKPLSAAFFTSSILKLAAPAPTLQNWTASLLIVGGALAASSAASLMTTQFRHDVLTSVARFRVYLYSSRR